jgi:Zn-dependent M28 family amino/carboxypeptidase
MSLFLRRLFFVFAFLPAFLNGQENQEVMGSFGKFIDAGDLKKHLSVLASDKYEGRETGKRGQKRSARYLAKEFKKIGASPPGDTSYFQTFELSFKGHDTKDTGKKSITKVKTENVIAIIEGSDLKEEVIVISAHYDHLGVKGKKVYNGADDDGSGTVALLEIAQAFAEAKRAGYGPRRTIVFIAFTGEEKGLLGSKFYVSNPTYPLEKTVCNLNIDMVGRIDKAHEKDTNYVYIIGSDMLSTQLHALNEKANELYGKLGLDYKYNDPKDKNRFYYRSDHYNFAKNNIPVIFYFNGVHEDYHRDTDEIHKINFWMLEKRARLVFYTAWLVANQEKRITVDKKPPSR